MSQITNKSIGERQLFCPERTRTLLQRHRGQISTQLSNATWNKNRNLYWHTKQNIYIWIIPWDIDMTGSFTTKCNCIGYKVGHFLNLVYHCIIQNIADFFLIWTAPHFYRDQSQVLSTKWTVCKIDGMLPKSQVQLLSKSCALLNVLYKTANGIMWNLARK